MESVPINLPESTIKKTHKFGPNDLNLESAKVTHWHIIAPEGVEMKDLLDPAAWANIAHRLRPMARIHVVSDPGHYVGELFVVAAGNLWANVRVVSYNDFRSDADMVDTSAEEYQAKWISNRYGFGIFRVSDKQWILKDLPDMASAQAALAAQLNEMRKTA